MLGDFLTRVLVTFLGYVYPAFECFKSVEKNKADIDELRFWCQYWIIVAALTVFERIGEVFISWLPMYGEAKLAFFIYLWYPKTRGTSYVYDTFLCPYIAKHETEIDQRLQELKARAWDLVLVYWKNFASQGQTKFFEILQFLAKQSALRPVASQGAEPQPNPETSIHKQQEPKPQQSTVRRHSSAPSAVVIKRDVSESPKAVDQVVQMAVPEEKMGTVMVGTVAETPITPSAPKDQTQDTEAIEGTLRAARVRLRRATSQTNN